MESRAVMNNDLTTLNNILFAGKQEFLEKGFHGASLRNIVKEAGVTTGAFYGYFKSKQDLFSALVNEPAHIFLQRFTTAQETFAQLPPEQQPGQMGVISSECMDWMVDYIYRNFDAFKLILCCAEGTVYENFIHKMVEIEIDGTHRFMDVLRNMGQPVHEMDNQLEHILISGMFSGFFEIVIHDMPIEKSKRYVHELQEFYTAGWRKIMGL